MKVRVHVLGALFGGLCAIAFAVAPFLSHADSGPGRNPAPKVVKKHMIRGNVSRFDDGCGS